MGEGQRWREKKRERERGREGERASEHMPECMYVFHMQELAEFRKDIGFLECRLTYGCEPLCGWSSERTVSTFSL